VKQAKKKRAAAAAMLLLLEEDFVCVSVYTLFLEIDL
jgi:hypothetical protein